MLNALLEVGPRRGVDATWYKAARRWRWRIGWLWNSRRKGIRPHARVLRGLVARCAKNSQSLSQRECSERRRINRKGCVEVSRGGIKLTRRQEQSRLTQMVLE